MTTSSALSFLSLERETAKARAQTETRNREHRGTEKEWVPRKQDARDRKGVRGGREGEREGGRKGVREGGRGAGRKG